MDALEEPAAGWLREIKAPVTPNSPDLDRLVEAIGEEASRRDRDRVLPYPAIDLIRRARLGALRLPSSDGGAGSTNRELFATVVKLGRADANIAHIVRNHFSFVERFLRGEIDESRRRWVKAVAEGAIFGLAYGELETAQVGTISGASINTVLEPDGAGYRVSGKKYYSTGSLYADYVVVRVRFRDGALASAIVPADRAGVELVDDWDGFGQRLTGSGTTILENVRVEADEVVPDGNGEFYARSYSGVVPQLILTAINAGIVQAILDDAVALVRRRERSYAHASAEKPSDDPLLQVVVGQIASYGFSAEATVLAAADALDRLDAARSRTKQEFEALSHTASLQASQAKVTVDELAIRAGSLLFDVGGASSTRQIYNLDRHWRNARTLANHNPTSYKARAIGDHAINGAPLPLNGFF